MPLHYKQIFRRASKVTSLAAAIADAMNQVAALGRGSRVLLREIRSDLWPFWRAP